MSHIPSKERSGIGDVAEHDIAESENQDSQRHSLEARSQDAVELARVGKVQVLQRRFGFLSIFGFCSLTTTTWEGTMAQYAFGLTNGGPAGLIYGYFASWLGTLCVFLAMAELSSMMPTAGGQYHWVSVLAPKRTRRLLSYMTGWATVVSWAAAATVDAYVSASMIQAAVNLNVPQYEGTRWQGTLILIAVLALAVLTTTVVGVILPAVEIVFLIVHGLTFLAVVASLAYHAGSLPASGARARMIFTDFFNLGGWSSQTLSFFVGMQGNASALLGLDGAIHMAEEVEKSSVSVARSMICSIVFNGLLGFSILLALSFSVENFDALVMSTSTFPFIDILLNAIGSVHGTTVILAALIFTSFASTVCALASASRMMWSFGRDRGPPGWQWLKRIDRRTSIPFNTIYVSAAFAGLVGLINIGSTTAFQAIISLTVEGFYMSYLLAISALLYRRLRGEIRDRDDRFPDWLGHVDEGAEADVKLPCWGPWRLPGLFGAINNVVAVAYVVPMCFFGFWPVFAQTNAENMNYSCVVLGAVLIGSLVWYYARARKYYSGPVHEIRITANGSRSPS